MSATTRFLRNRREKQREPQTRLQKIVNNVGIFGLFATVGLLILGLFKIYTLTSFMFGFISTIALISLGCFLIIPWLRYFEKGEYRKTSITFMALIGVCVILWLICVYLGIHIYNQAKLNITYNDSLNATLKLIKVTAIISLQLMISSTIAGTIIKYKKEMLFFQVITYASNLFFDFYLTTLMICLSIVPNEGLQIAKATKFLFTKGMVVLLVLSIVYMFLSSKIMEFVDIRRFRNAVTDYNEKNREEQVEEPVQEQAEQSNNSVEERLAKLQSMFDKNLITKEEFEEKRKNILEDL